MRLSCPACGAQTSLEAMTEDAAARRVAALFGEFPAPVARVLPAYLALFRPAKTGLRWSRAEAVIAELVPLVRDGFRRSGRSGKASADQWATAMHQVCSRDIRRPLKSHGYLLEVVASLADSHAAQAETEHHQAMRDGHRPARREPAPAAGPAVDAAEAIMDWFKLGYISDEEKQAKLAELERAR